MIVSRSQSDHCRCKLLDQHMNPCQLPTVDHFNFRELCHIENLREICDFDAILTGRQLEQVGMTLNRTELFASGQVQLACSSMLPTICHLLQILFAAYVFRSFLLPEPRDVQFFENCLESSKRTWNTLHSNYWDSISFYNYFYNYADVLRRRWFQVPTITYEIVKSNHVSDTSATVTQNKASNSETNER